MPKLAVAVAETEEVLTFEEMTAVLEGVAGAARSGYGIARALADIARMLLLCPWIEGDLRLELVADAADRSTLQIYTEQGGIRERAVTPVTFTVPLDEIEMAVNATISAFAPLHVRRHKGKVVFTSMGMTATVPPPEVEVAADSITDSVTVTPEILGSLRASRFPSDTNPHTRPTVKRVAYALPEEATRTQSGTHLRRDPRRDDD